MLTVVSPQALKFSARTKQRPSIGSKAHSERRLSAFSPLSVSQGIHPCANADRYFLRGTEHQTSLMREGPILQKVAEWLLTKFPLGQTKKAHRIQIHGASDGRERVSLVFALLDTELAKRGKQQGDSPEQKRFESGLLKKLGRHFRVLGIEQNQELVKRASSGFIEMTDQDEANLAASANMTRLFRRHCRPIPPPPKVLGNRLPLFSTERYLHRAAGQVALDDMFKAISSIKKPQVAILARNSLGYFPERYAEYAQALGKALVSGGVFVIGQFEVNNPDSESPSQGSLVTLLEKAGLDGLQTDPGRKEAPKIFVKRA